MLLKFFFCILCTCAWAAAGMPMTPEHIEESRNDTSVINTRASYYCEWDWWKNRYWTGLNQVRSKDRVNSFHSCATRCCHNPYCATFDWNKSGKTCYEYNQNIGTDELFFEKMKGWRMGALTYKNGYSYV